MTLRVALVDDYDVVVQGLATMLRRYRERVSAEALVTSDDMAADVDIALYDSFANPPADAELLGRLSTDPRIGKVVVYAWDLDERTIRTALANGAAACISKKLPAGELVDALEAIHRDGEQLFLGNARTFASNTGDWPGREEGLTQRESEILALITQGMSNTDIAAYTNLSINSVKTHIRSCYRRIGATSRAQAVLWGAQNGFLPDRPSGR